MAQSYDGLTFTVGATTGLTQYTFMDLNTVGRAIKATGGGTVVGVLVNDPTATDEEAVIQYTGVAKVLCSTVSTGIGIGDRICCSTDAKVCPSSAGDYVVGIVVNGSSGSSTGRVVGVMLAPIGTT